MRVCVRKNWYRFESRVRVAAVDAAVDPDTCCLRHSMLFAAERFVGNESQRPHYYYRHRSESKTCAKPVCSCYHALGGRRASP